MDEESRRFMANDLDQQIAEGHRFAQRRQPQAVGFTIELPDGAKHAIGSLAIMWTLLEHKVAWTVRMLRLHQRADRQTEPHERLERNLTIIGDGVAQAYSDRTHVVKEYARLQKRILDLRLLRNRLVHGDYWAGDQLSHDHLVVRHKGRLYTYSIQDLRQIEEDISQTIGLVNEFHEWANWPETRRSLERMRDALSKPI